LLLQLESGARRQLTQHDSHLRHGDHAKRRDVQVAFIETAGVALSEGLRPGERVVTDGALYLQDNDRIVIVQDATKVVGTVSLGAG